MEPKRWITVKGNHIPILEGQTIGEAINNRFYHGSNKTFDKFDVNKSKWGTMGQGIYLTTDKKWASDFGNNIREYDIEESDLYEFDSKDEFIKLANKLGLSITKDDLSDYNFSYPLEVHSAYQDLIGSITEFENINKAAKAAGYEGMYRGLGNRMDEIMMFDANKIKSLNDYEEDL